MHLVASICLSVHLSVLCHQSDECLCDCNQGAFADNLAGAFDQLLFLRVLDEWVISWPR